MEPIETGRGRWGTVLPIVAVLGALAAAVAFGVMLLGPSGDGDDDGVATGRTATTGTDADTDDDADDDGSESTATSEAQVSPSATSATAPPPTTAPVGDLLAGGFPTTLADLLAAAGQPGQLLELTVYAEYAFLAYRDPFAPSVINRREWRAGRVGEASANPIADRADADTEPDLFAPAELGDPTLVAQLVADAPLHYDVPVRVTHVIIDRFLPFDARVLIRVYAVPTDGRSGGGYVSYDTAGALVRVCC